MIYLLIKTHNETGLKYFCKATDVDVEKYTGSGKYWKRHIKKHGYDVTTEVYAQFEKICDELVETALMFSKENNIAESKEWANLQDENGLDGAPKGVKFTEEHCKNISLSRQNISDEWRKNCSIGAKNRVYTEEGRIKRSKRFSGEGNINYGKKTSEESKKKRLRTLEEKGFSFEGGNNPMYGKKHTDESKKKMSEAAKGRKMSEETKAKLKEIVTCPHCGKQGGKSAMPRYHFDKCKSRKLALG